MDEETKGDNKGTFCLSADENTRIKETAATIIAGYSKLSGLVKAEDYYAFYKQKSSQSLSFIPNVLDLVKHMEVKVGGKDHKLLKEIHKGVYEGGFLLWECERDCIQYLNDNGVSFEGQNLNVLEIGCGSGLLGIRLLQLGAATLSFQDYNEEVLKFWTFPNLCLNFLVQDIATNCYFVKGDWKDFEQEASRDVIRQEGTAAQLGKYDLVVGCDIIYETKNYEAIAGLLKAALKPSGKAIIASKAYYYGNGGKLLSPGSVAEFKDFMDKAGFEYTRLKNIETGASNRREIFSLTLK